jgi:hypothetical protein
MSSTPSKHPELICSAHSIFIYIKYRMSHMSKNNAIAVLAALILSAVLLATRSIFQPARAQTNNAGGLLSASNFKDQIIKGGNHVMDEITKVELDS